MDQDNQMTLVFRCLPELAALLPPPVPAVQGLPDWFKSMPQKSFNPITQEETQTVKRCPPFIDAMAYGFLILLPCDLRVENGAFSWDFDAPVDVISNFMRSPLSFHDACQVVGTPYYEEEHLLIKFINFWTIEAPPGYSLLFTHPVNRPELPFTTLTGLVDSDLYVDNWVHFPAHWHDLNFSGVLPKGTPIAQCMPVKRESWVGRVETLSGEHATRARDMAHTMLNETGLYRREFRAGKR